MKKKIVQVGGMKLEISEVRVCDIIDCRQPAIKVKTGSVYTKQTTSYLCVKHAKKLPTK